MKKTKQKMSKSTKFTFIFGTIVLWFLGLFISAVLFISETGDEELVLFVFACYPALYLLYVLILKFLTKDNIWKATKSTFPLAIALLAFAFPADIFFVALLSIGTLCIFISLWVFFYEIVKIKGRWEIV